MRYDGEARAGTAVQAALTDEGCGSDLNCAGGGGGGAGEGYGYGSGSNDACGGAGSASGWLNGPWTPNGRGKLSETDASACH